MKCCSALQSTDQQQRSMRMLARKLLRHWSSPTYQGASTRTTAVEGGIDRSLAPATSGCCQTKSWTCLSDKFYAVRLGLKLGIRY